MGRGCTMDEWAHFEKLPEEGRVPNSSYWYVLCRHCVRGFEQKQLFNPPTKLTGRRSAMRAHLKICPMYATQYKMEQQQNAMTNAATAVGSPTVVASAVVGAGADAEANGNDGTKSSAETTQTAGINEGRRKRKSDDGSETSVSRGGRGKHCMMEEWEHFNRLQDDGYIGKSNFFYAICKHCQAAYDEAPEDKKPLLVPERMVGRREKLRKHLSLCPFFKGELPPLERRFQMRNGVATLFSPSGLILPGGRTNELGAGGDGSTGSSRLALDEWQYFTRLHRKKDSAYYFARCNFCQDAYENAPEALKTSMEPTIVMGRKSNMQTHLAKCPHIPKDALMLAKSSPIGGSVEYSYPPSKRIKLTATGLDMTSLYCTLLEFTIQNRLPFQWVESSSSKKMLRIVSSIDMDTIMPSSQELRTQILDDMHENTLTTELQQLKEVLPLDGIAFEEGSATMGSMANTWPVTLQLVFKLSMSESVVPDAVCSLANDKGRVPMNYILQKHRVAQESTTTDELVSEDNVEVPKLSFYHGLDVARYLDEHLRKSAELEAITPSVLVLPYSSVTERATGILRSLWPHIAFVFAFEDLLAFCLAKVLATEEVQAVLVSFVELWQLESVRSAVKLSSSNPFKNWMEFSKLTQVVLDESIGQTPDVKQLLDEAIDRELLERVSTLLCAFATAFDACNERSLSFASTVTHLRALFQASEGFPLVQKSLEVIWLQMEQPLLLLAHALNPHLRLRDINSTDLTKLSALSDLSVEYFTGFFGRKASSLRGEVTAYLHTSQPVFSRQFVSEFSVLNDYFRYLSDDFKSLSILMRVLHSFSTVRIANPSSKSKVDGIHQDSTSDRPHTEQERCKLDYLAERWNVAASRDDEYVESNTMSAPESGEAVLEKWTKALDAHLVTNAVDFTLLEKQFTALDSDNDEAVKSEHQQVPAALEQNAEKERLPTQSTDDELTFPSAALRGVRAKKVTLKELFRPAEATI